jgi:GNAT superfamily N-acetyltransferase
VLINFGTEDKHRSDTGIFIWTAFDCPGWKKAANVMTGTPFRGQGIGTRMINYAIQRAEERGCVFIQLTSDKKRPDALHFYKSPGFIDSHEGMKLKITYLNS